MESVRPKQAENIQAGVCKSMTTVSSRLIHKTIYQIQSFCADEKKIKCEVKTGEIENFLHYFSN